VFFFFKQKTAYEIRLSLVGSEMSIRDRITTDESLFTLVRGIKQILQVWVGAQIPAFNEAMALAILAIVPPVLIVVIFQSWFVKGLVESDK